MKHTDTGSLNKTCTALHTIWGPPQHYPFMHEQYIITGTFRGYAENEPVLYTIADNLMLISIGMLHSTT